MEHDFVLHSVTNLYEDDLKDRYNDDKVIAIT